MSADSRRTNNEYSLADNTVQSVTAEDIVYPIALLRPTHNIYLIEVNNTPREVRANIHLCIRRIG